MGRTAEPSRTRGKAWFTRSPRGVRRIQRNKTTLGLALDDRRAERGVSRTSTPERPFLEKSCGHLLDEFSVSDPLLNITRELGPDRFDVRLPAQDRHPLTPLRWSDRALDSFCVSIHAARRSERTSEISPALGRRPRGVGRPDFNKGCGSRAADGTAEPRDVAPPEVRGVHLPPSPRAAGPPRSGAGPGRGRRPGGDPPQDPEGARGRSWA